MSIANKLIRGSSANLLDHLIKIAAVFYTSPLMLHSLTAEGYGSWLLAMNIIGYFLMLDLGVSFASTRFFAMAVGSGDELEQGAVIQVTRRFFQIVSLAILLLTFASLPLMPWLGSPAFNTWEVTAPLAICGVVTALRFALRMPIILLRANVRYDLLAWSSITRTCAQVAMMTYALKSGHGLIGAAVAHASGDLIELASQWFFARQLPVRPTLLLDPDKVRVTRRKLFSYSNSIMLAIIGDGLHLQVNPILISKTSGVAELPLYSIGLRLIAMLEDVVNALFGGQILAAFSQLHGADKQEALRSQFKRVTCLTASFSAWAVGGVAIFGHAFFIRWMGPEFGRAHNIMLLLALPYALRLMQYPVFSLLYSLNLQRPLIWINFIGSLVAVVIALALAPKFGLYGIVLGTALQMTAIHLFVLPSLVLRGAGIHRVDFLLNSVIWPGLRSLFLPALFAFAIRDWITPDYFRLFLCGAGYALVFALTAPWLSLDAEMRASIRNAIGLRPKS